MITQLDRLELTEGDTFNQDYVLTDADDSAIDITGYSITLGAKVNLDDTTSFWTMTAVIDPDQVTNKGKFSFTGTVPASTIGKYTIRIVDTGAGVTTEVAGGSDIRIYPSAYVAP